MKVVPIRPLDREIESDTAADDMTGTKAFRIVLSISNFAW